MPTDASSGPSSASPSASPSSPISPRLDTRGFVAATQLRPSSGRNWTRSTRGERCARRSASCGASSATASSPPAGKKRSGSTPQPWAATRERSRMPATPGRRPMPSPSIAESSSKACSSPKGPPSSSSGSTRSEAVCAAAAAWAVAAEHRAAGDRAEAAAIARRAARFAPESEIELVRLIRFLDDLGDRAAALAAYDEFARRLLQEFAAAPSPETQALIQAVRQRTRTIAAPYTATARLPGVESPPPVPAAVPDPIAAAPPARPVTVVPQRLLVTLALLGLLLLSVYLVAFSTRGRHLVVAVLPIRGIPGASAARVLADELTDELIADLAQVRTLRMINTSTMQRYRDSTPQDVMRARRVSWVVLTTIRPRGDSIRLTAEVVPAGSDEAAWTGVFDCSRNELFRMRREVARQIAEQLRGKPADLAAA